MSRASKGNKAFSILVSGKVQGVGFRPFIFRTAKSLGLNGFVANSTYGAVIKIEGKQESIDVFIRNLKSTIPPNSNISSIKIQPIPLKNYKIFSITKSLPGKSISADIPPDLCVCTDCACDIYSKNNRRYLYPFTNCTNCGPRFSIIKGLPYDRKKTTMKGFSMCKDCEREYNDPLNRRFQAQPNACPVCGPKVTLLSNSFKPLASGATALAEAIRLLKEGKIGALKSIGGYHLACDATNRRTVKRLRELKRRPFKPFALMMPNIGTAKKYCHINKSESKLLTSTSSPIVLLTARKVKGLPYDILAPGNNRLGVMLAYTPLHKLLFDSCDTGKFNFKALVMTSGNRSDEPICIDEKQVNDRLSGIADFFLVNDRPIHNRCDDSIIINLNSENNVFVRRSRGFVPEPACIIARESSTPVVLAAGAELKNTFCFVRGASAYPSQFIGDLDNLESSRFYEEAFLRMKDFLKVTPSIVAHDLHPDYYSTIFANKLLKNNPRLKTTPVQHHHAHIASVIAEKGIKGPVIGIAFDGNGMGSDGNVWGGECLLAEGAGFTRLAHLDYFRLPGGDIATKEIWRLAVSLAHKYSIKGLPATVKRRNISNFIDTMIAREVNSPLCSSMGRLFDAVASLIGIRQEVTFEAQAAIEMESLAMDNPVKKGYNFDIVFSNDSASCPTPALISVKKVIEGILRDLSSGVDKSIISAKFHFTVSEMIHNMARKFCAYHNINNVVLQRRISE